MTPTNELRFVERTEDEHADYNPPIRVLQQLWRNENAPIGYREEWRDVPMVKEEV